MCHFRFWPKLRVRVPGVSVRVVCVPACVVRVCVRMCSLPYTFVCTACRCTRVCGCAARRSNLRRLDEHLLLCGSNQPRKISRARQKCTSARFLPPAVRAEFLLFLEFAEKRNFFFALRRGGTSDSRRQRSRRRHESAGSVRFATSDDRRDVSPRHVSVCRLVRNLGLQSINPKLLVSKANLEKRR